MDFKTEIDFELIWRAINAPDTLKESEKIFIQGWKAESSQNRAFYQRAVDRYAGNPNIKPDNFNKTAAWRSLRAKVKNDVDGRKWVYSIASSVLLIFSVYFIWGVSNYQSIGEDKIVKIIPGSNKAQLIMSDGSVVELISGKQVLIEDNEVPISSNGSQIVYDQSVSGEMKSGINQLVIPRGGKYQLVLSDGTRVWLNSESSLSYPTVFGSTERLVELIGEAYFEVAKDAERPFKVKTPEQTVAVLGTHFNVTAYNDSDFVTTTLVEGSVQVTVADSGIKQILVPNYQSKLNKSTKEISTNQVNTSMFTGWTNDHLIFENESLENILNTLSRWYDVQIFYENSGVKTIPFTGEIRRYERLEKVLSLIEKTDVATFKINKNAVIVSKK